MCPRAHDQSGQKFLDHLRTEWRDRDGPDAGVVLSLRINTESVVDRREEVAFGNRVVLNVDSVFVRRTVDKAAFHAATGERGTP